MSLAIFDLDNTLLGGDSDYLWGQFLVEQGIVDKQSYEQANTQFYADYKQGNLDISEFLAFALRPLAEYPPEVLYRWRDQFIEEKIKPILLPAAKQLINKHGESGHTLLIITATNQFVTEPIAGLYGIDHLLATTPEFIDGQFTGRYTGIPCFQSGKVKRLDQWLKRNKQSLQNSWFYSDSFNDMPLLKRVDHPVAVDPDEKLECFAKQAGWPILSLRGDV